MLLNQFCRIGKNLIKHKPSLFVAKKSLPYQYLRYFATKPEDLVNKKVADAENKKKFTQEIKQKSKPLDLDELLQEPLVKDIIEDTTLDTVVNAIKSDPRYRNAGTQFPLQAAEKEPVRIAVTGAAGNIGYAVLFRIASGQMLGNRQPVILHLLEIPAAMTALKGVVMELEDCAFPLLRGVVATDDPNKAFENIDYALLIGAKPRGKGMERNDLLKDNAALFATQGKALNKTAKKDVRVLVVGNPANTNALIASHNAPDINPANFTAMTRLDHNRAIAQLAIKTKTADTGDIERLAIWGNHSSTMYPDISHTLIKGKWAKQIINDDSWITNTFIPTVQKRGAAIIEARGASSAASAASAAIDHMHDWVLGSNGKWVSMAIPSDGTYGIEAGVYCSYPVICDNGHYYRITNVPVDRFSAERIEISRKELFEERNAVASLLK